MAVKLTKRQAVEKLERSIQQIDAVKQKPYFSPAFKKWHRDTEIAISNIFNPHSRHSTDFSGIQFAYARRIHNDQEKHERDTYYYFAARLEDARAVLQSMVQEIEEYWTDDMISAPSSVAEQNESGQVKPATRDVFIVHGHDDGFRQTVARVLHQLELNPIILHEKANEGKTIMEKFDAYGNVSYAVALFTPDDVGESVTKVKTLEDLKPRARQNVVFELGYFIGRRGRSNACALVKGQLELPSDYSGVIYIPVDDAGAWRYTLVRELRAAGFDVDANRLL